VEVVADAALGRASAGQPADERIRLLAVRCRAVLGDLTLLRKPPGYSGSLALCVLDAIWSMGVRCRAVEHVIGRYREHRRGQGGDPDRDSLAELLATIDQAGSPEGLAELLGNHQLTATRNGVLKAHAVAIAARTLARQGSIILRICGSPSAGTGPPESRRIGERFAASGPASAGRICCCSPACRGSSQTG
jgi:hypothetical protein